MNRTPAVALSILLAPSMALTMDVLAFCSTGSDKSTAATESNAVTESDASCCYQPGRLETAQEIKTEADEFVLKGRDLSVRLNAQIAEAEKLTNEAKKLLAQAVDNQPSTEADATKSDATKTEADATKSDATKTEATKSDTDKKVKDETLTGRASQLQTLQTPNIPLIKLKGPQLQQAMQQFNADVAQFKVHAAEYQKHLNMFRSQIGECQAAKGAFDALHKKYEMHCDAYHLNNIPPPHLCLEMNVSASEASSIANQLMSDQMRALRAEAQLNAEEAKLRQLEGMQGNADNLVVKASERARREKEIAGMFGRLRQEYDLLEIERKTIEHSRSASSKSSPVVRPYVSGKVKKGK